MGAKKQIVLSNTLCESIFCPAILPGIFMCVFSRIAICMIHNSDTFSGEIAMNDKQIQEILVAHLKSQNSEMRIFHEKNIGGSTCDLIMVTPDGITGFEIKSDLDNYQRLDSQVQHYDRFFQYKYYEE